MKLLFDNNLSHKLAQRLSDIFPGSTHVMTENLDESKDQDIWFFAKEKGFTIVPLKIFINNRGFAKLEIGVGKGKKLHDKRESIKERDLNREQQDV